MSADNYILIRKEKYEHCDSRQWVGYMQCTSRGEVNYDRQLFCTDFLEDAITLAQEQDAEYGYKFEVGGLYANSS